ncbi:hypothetical protein BaRGS_00004090, partial [Batillaria attramentaria]
STRILGLAALILCMVRARGEGCSGESDGCTIPSGLAAHVGSDNLDLFTPACERHDVCFDCGADYGKTEMTCNIDLKADIKALCSDDDDDCQKAAKLILKAVVHYSDEQFHDVGETESYCSDAWVATCLA